MAGVSAIGWLAQGNCFVLPYPPFVYVSVRFLEELTIPVRRFFQRAQGRKVCSNTFELQLRQWYVGFC